MSFGGPIKFEGLGSGIHTQEIVNALMAVERQPLQRLQNQKTVTEDQEQALNSLLNSFRSLQLASAELGSPLLFQTAQTVTSTDPSLVNAALTGTAPPGGYTVTVSQLATAAQRTFTYKAPSAETAITVEGRELKVRSGETVSELAAAINGNSELKLLAFATNSETLVLAERETGEQTGPYISVSGGTVLTEVTADAYAGSNAHYTINGKEGTSRQNVLKEAVPGLTITLSGLTPAGGVTLAVSSPETNPKQIVEAVKGFISAYNSALSTLDGELNTKPKTGLAAEAQYGKGTLFGDAELLGIEGQLRQQIYTPLAGLSGPYTNLTAIGVSSGQASGSLPPSQSSIEGKLTFEESKLLAALSENPSAVKSLLSQFSTAFNSLLEGYLGGTGTFSSRISGDEQTVAQLKEEIANEEANLALRQQRLETSFVAMETVVGRLKSQSAYVSAQLSKLQATSTAVL